MLPFVFYTMAENCFVNASVNLPTVASTNPLVPLDEHYVT